MAAARYRSHLTISVYGILYRNKRNRGEKENEKSICILSYITYTLEDLRTQLKRGIIRVEVWSWARVHCFLLLVQHWFATQRSIFFVPVVQTFRAYLNRPHAFFYTTFAIIRRPGFPPKITFSKAISCVCTVRNLSAACVRLRKRRAKGRTSDLSDVAKSIRYTYGWKRNVKCAAIPICAVINRAEVLISSET